MQSQLRIVRVLLVFVLLSIFGAQGCKTEEKKNRVYDRKWNDMARFVAGMPVEEGSTLTELYKSTEAAAHQKFFADVWPRVESGQLDAQRKWAEKELAFARQRDRFVFYPFSGADFLNIFTFFPNGDNYIFFGLEPAGSPPDLNAIAKNRLSGNLANIQVSLKSILNQSYFQTLHMESDFRRADLKGAIPLLLVFIARTGNQVMEVEQVMIGKDAKLYKVTAEDVDRYSEKKKKEPAKDAKKGKDEPEEPEAKEGEKLDPNLIGGIPGIRVIFRKPGETKDRTVVYFSLDISDPAIVKKPFFFDHIRQNEPAVTYIKAASYLLHWDNFTMIRNFILDRSTVLLQDDTGVPIKYYDKNLWELSFYGNYLRPIPLFAGQYQPDLRQVYVKGEGVKALPFGIGYQWQVGRSNLILAKKKTGAEDKK